MEIFGVELQPASIEQSSAVWRKRRQRACELLAPQLPPFPSNRRRRSSSSSSSSSAAAGKPRGADAPLSPTRLAIYMAAMALVRLALGGHGGHPFGAAAAERMVRLCIASVDPVKLSSQCVMCNRREFPLTVIDCTGITKVNELIANPLSVQEATCLIYNCRRQVPEVKPEPYHGSVSHAANYRGAASSAMGSRHYEMMTPSGMLGGGYSLAALQPPPPPPIAPFMSRFGAGFGAYGQASGGGGSSASYLPLGPLAPKGLIGGPSYMPDRNRGAALPYALVPAPSTFPFGVRNKYKMALLPLFR